VKIYEYKQNKNKKAPTGEACLLNRLKQGNMAAKIMLFFNIQKKM